MRFKTIVKPQNISEIKKLNEKFEAFNSFLLEVGKKEIPVEIHNIINQEIEALNSVLEPPSAYKSRLCKTQTKIVKILEKEMKIVSKNHYRSQWIVLGMTIFGLPLGMALGMSIDNLALLGIGFPLGMAIGLAVGSQLDKKAEEKGNQIGVELKF